MAVLVDLTKCIGCESCVVACKLWNKLPYHVKHTVKRKENDLDDVHWTVVQKKRVQADNGKAYTRFVKKQCMHCLEPACASACFSKALRVDENHAVVYYPDLCVGCRYCMMACPYDVPRYQWEKALPLVTKCQMCSDRLKEGEAPACVGACPTGTLTYGDRDGLIKKAHSIIAHDSKYVDYVYGEKELGGASWLYISDQPFEKLGFKMDLEDTPPSQYTRGYLTKVPFLAAAWGLFLVGLTAYHHHRENKRKEADKDE